jgi:pyrroloquinoline quinone biosynthesis protein B
VRVKILGSAAGGGFPQWNCGCANCSRQRQGVLNAVPRSQIQVAITADDRHWFLLNASPDLRTQIEATPELHPRSLRDTPIEGVVLTTGDLDQVLGLLLMRELQPIRIYATEAVRAIVQRENAFFNMLTQHEGQSRWMPIEATRSFTLEANGCAPLVCRPVSLGSGYPAWVPPPLAQELPREQAVLGLVIHRGPQQKNGDARRSGGPTVADAGGYGPTDGPPVADAGPAADAGRLGYFPACGKITPEMISLLEGCDVVLFDGTFWDDNELKRAQEGARTARQMGHVPLGGGDGSLAMLASLRRPRKILIHINNTNLDRDSAEHRQVMESGWEIAEDGWDIQL